MEFPELLVLTVVTELKEKWVTLVRMELEVQQVKREPQVYLAQLENLEDPVWMELKDQPDETEIPVDLESPVAREVLADLEALESPVAEESLDVTVLKENLAEEVLMADLELPV